MFRHPSKVCMTYKEHLVFSMWLSKEFAKASAVAALHALLPDTFVTHSTDTLKKLEGEMAKVGCKSK